MIFRKSRQARVVDILTHSSSARPQPSIQPYPKATLRMGDDTRQCEKANTGVSSCTLPGDANTNVDFRSE